MERKSSSGSTAILCKRLLVLFLCIQIVAAAAPVCPAAAAPSSSAAYRVEITESFSNGFTHPGVGLTKPVLENMRNQVLNGKEPWYSYYKAMIGSAAAAKTVTSSNQSSTNPEVPASTAFNSQGFNQRFIQDGLKAYTQALMYYITGEELYRANAMQIIRIWSQMDPAQYVYFTDAHIHTGIPLNRMVTAAEILRYSSYQDASLQWTEEDTVHFSSNLINPVIETFLHDNNQFMNQHNYPLLGAMAGYIFTGNKERYEEAVEWATVNKTALNQGFNGSIKQLYRLVDTNAATGERLDKPVVQHVEMGRDQAHGAGDLTNSAILARMFLAQNTKVDPVEGTVSEQADAVGYYEFLNDRVLAATDYFWQFMLGYDTPWTPVAHSIRDGEVKGIYYKISDLYKGRTNTALFWDMYYYYTYTKGFNLEEKAPYFHEAFTKRSPSNYYYKGVLTQAWESVDGGGDFWIYIPGEAAAEGAKYLPKEQTNPALVELEERYTAFDSRSETRQEGSTSYVRFNTTPAGSNIAVQNLSFADRSSSRLIGLLFRSDGPATLELSTRLGGTPYHTLTLPDTEGQWKYITFDMGINHVSYGQLDTDFSLVYMKAAGNGALVDVEHFNVLAKEQLTPPVFKEGKEDLSIDVFAGASISLDLSASAAGKSLRYTIAELPEGARLDAVTGAFVWQPARAGIYSFTVTAEDGTTLETKNIRISVAQDRSGAVTAIASLYNPDTPYVTASRLAFEAAYEETVKQIGTASNEDFSRQLLALRNAAERLQLLTPLLKDGTMDYSQLVTSTFGTSLPLLVDDNDNTFPVYSLAPYPDLVHILDFGADYKITADAFAMEGRMNFDDRMAGSTVFGSNDGVTWERLTPGQTEFTADMSVLEVADELKQTPFRMIKIQMIDPQPDVLRGNITNMLELSEFRITGQRQETNNKLESVSLSSPQGINGRIARGDTIRLSFRAKEAISQVAVRILDTEATAVTTDGGLNWSAELKTTAEAPIGNITFRIDYMDQNGGQGDTVYLTTDGSKFYLADTSNEIPNVLQITTLIDSTAGSGRTAAETLKQTGYLFDNLANTFSDYRINGSGAGSYIIFDFREGNAAALTGAELLARQDQYYTRLRGAVVQGSNDLATWETLTKAAGSTREWQYVEGVSQQAYRYLRIYNSGSWFGNMAEVKLHGAVVSLNQIQSVSIRSEQGVKNRITAGNTVTLDIAAKTTIRDVTAVIQGLAATVHTADGIHYTAEAVIGPDAAAGPITFSIQYKREDGGAGSPVTATSDSSVLFIADETGLLSHLAEMTELIDSTTGRTAADTRNQVNRLFDGDAGTSSDFRLGSSSGTGASLIFDFKEGNTVQLSHMELLARQDQYYTRIKGTRLQGSHDLQTWTDLTVQAASTTEWQTFPVTDPTPYRYLRLYNSGAWFGNMAELRLHAKEKHIPVTGVEMSATTLQLTEGEVYQLNAIVMPADATNREVHWESSNTSVAAVDSSGRVTAVSAGTAVISVTTVDGGFTARTTVTVIPSAQPVAYLRGVNETAAGGEFDLIYGFTGVTGSVYSTSLAVHYDPSLFSYKGAVPLAEHLSVTGEVYASPSQVRLAAASQGQGYSGSMELLQLRFGALLPSSTVSGTVYLSGTGVTDAAGTWVSLTPGGTHTITVTVPEEPQVIQVTGIELDNGQVSLVTGQTLQFIATITPANATNRDVSWTTSNPGTAVVDTTGKVTAVRPGTAIITASSVDGGFQASAAVVVTAVPTEPEEEEPGPSAPANPVDSGKPERPAGIVEGKQIIMKAALDSPSLRIAVHADQLAQAVSYGGNGPIVIKAEPREETEEIRISVPLQELAAWGQQNPDGLQLDTGFAKLHLTPAFLKNNSGLMEFIIAKADARTLPSGTREKLENGSAIYDMQLTINGIHKSSLDGHEVEVEFPYSLKPGQNPFKVILYHIRDDGRLEIVKNAKYQPEVGALTFRPEHFSLYTAAYVNSTFQDLQSVDWAKEAIEGLAARGIVQGTGDGLFQPGRNVTRAEFVALLMNALDWQDAAADSTFQDIRKDQWYYSAIAGAQQRGIVEGKPDHTFSPDESITRQDMAVMLQRALQVKKLQPAVTHNSVVFPDQASISSYAEEAIRNLGQYGIVEGMENGAFAPYLQANRAQAAVMMFRVLQIF